MKRLLWLGAVWPVAFFPFLSDPTPSSARADMAADTTYADDRFVVHVPGEWFVQGGDSMWVPAEDSIGVGAAYRAVMLSDSTWLVVSYDTLAAEAKDSTWVDSVWSAESIPTPYAYAVDVPNAPDTGTGLIGDTASATMYWFADMYDSTADYLADRMNNGTSYGGVDAIYGSGGGRGDTVTFIDSSTAYADLESSLRYDFIYDGTDPACADSATKQTGCEAQYIITALWNNNIDHDSLIEYREVWFEFSLKHDTNFFPCTYNETWGTANLPFTNGETPDTTGWTELTPPCAHKLVEWTPRVSNDWGRFMFVPGGGGGPEVPLVLEMFYGDTINGDAPDFEGFLFTQDVIAEWQNPQLKLRDNFVTYFYDNKWHRVRVHLWPSTDSLTMDGGMEVWLDSIMIASTDSSSSPIRTIEGPDAYWTKLRLGANKDDGGVFAHTESMWWGHAIIWNTAPSWY